MWPFEVFILNLPPELRLKADFLMIPLLFPGPKMPGNFHPVMDLLRREISQLEEGEVKPSCLDFIPMWIPNGKEFVGDHSEICP